MKFTELNSEEPITNNFSMQGIINHEEVMNLFDISEKSENDSGLRVPDKPLSETRPTYVFLTDPYNLAKDIPESYSTTPKDVFLSRAIFETAQNELSRIVEDSDPEERFSGIDAGFMGIIRRDPLQEKSGYFPEGKAYTEEEYVELKKAKVDVFVQAGHGVLFPDGSWMTGLASQKFHGHIEHGSCALCPKTRYNFNPDKFWGKSGPNVPVDQHVFGPPEGPPCSLSPTQERRLQFNQENQRAKYDRTRQVMVEQESKRARKAQESLVAFDRDNAQLMEH